MTFSEKRKLKRIAATQEQKKRSPREQVNSNITSRLKNYETKLFQNLKEEEEKQAHCIQKLQNTYVSDLKDKYL